ncbi:DUF1206 domain-containing protein [Maritimibacter sp. DP1N21-5]|uniref:DUF1206 domain-containing protein n=1 Tax=Maritimibacter sp. DP1N21-5 TaxID=2836867 RepID=UPI001C43E64A|nr:DUF1206 domain-containing protein [Maritimibacter sp. DP1N21-5]MBV7410770.1 DUF1206 domain-containing protein [Maritimibacter sp. DP1N21-5]
MSLSDSFSRAPGWVVPLMRFGYTARGLTYFILGGLTFLAAWTGGQAEGTSSALGDLRGTSWGVPMLWVIALGLASYAIWRFVAAWYDLELHGAGFKGWVARIGLTVTGVIHAVLAVSVARQAIGSGEEGDGVQSFTSMLMAQDPWGPTVVVIAGLITIGAGIYYAVKAMSERYKRYLSETPTSRRLDPAVKVGLVAHGAVIVLIGIFLTYAGFTTDPSQAGGMGQAFEAVRGVIFGRFLLMALGLGLVAFAVYCVIEAVYRIVPRCGTASTQTLAGGYMSVWDRRIGRLT